MDLYINIEPSVEEVENLFIDYKEKENLYENIELTEVVTTIKYSYIIVLPIFLFVLISALFLTILRLPFILVTKFRILFLSWWDRKKQLHSIRKTGDNRGPFYSFDKKKTDKEEIETSYKKVEDKLKKDLKNGDVNLNTVLNYANLNSLVKNENHLKKRLFILHQLKELPKENSKLDYGILYQSLCNTCIRLELPNQCKYYEGLGIKEGNKLPSKKGSIVSGLKTTYAQIFYYAYIAWSCLKTDIYNSFKSYAIK